MTKRKPKTRPKRIPEAQRHTVQLKLRVQEPVSDILRDQSEVQGIPVSGLVSELVLRTWGHQYDVDER